MTMMHNPGTRHPPGGGGSGATPWPRSDYLGYHIDVTGTTDSTAGLIAFMQSRKPGEVTQGRPGDIYRVDEIINLGGVQNVTYDFNGAKFQTRAAPSTATDAGHMIRLRECVNVRFRRGILWGPWRTSVDVLKPYQSATSDSAHGFMLESCLGVEIDHMEIQYTAGDGVHCYRNLKGSNTPTVDTWVHDCVIKNCGRQCVSIGAATGVVVERCTLANSNRSGMDIEPNNITLDGGVNIWVLDNTWNNIGLNMISSVGGQLSPSAYGGLQTDIHVKRNHATKSGSGQTNSSGGTHGGGLLSIDLRPLTRLKSCTAIHSSPLSIATSHCCDPSQPQALRRNSDGSLVVPYVLDKACAPHDHEPDSTSTVSGGSVVNFVPDLSRPRIAGLGWVDQYTPDVYTPFPLMQYARVEIVGNIGDQVDNSTPSIRLSRIVGVDVRDNVQPMLNSGLYMVQMEDVSNVRQSGNNASPGNGVLFTRSYASHSGGWSSWFTSAAPTYSGDTPIDAFVPWVDTEPCQSLGRTPTEG